MDRIKQIFVKECFSHGMRNNYLIFAVKPLLLVGQKVLRDDNLIFFSIDDRWRNLKLK